MIVELRPLAEITQEGLRVLYAQLGLIDTVRFINQFATGYGNYTEERRNIVAQQTFEEALAEVQAYQKAKVSGAG
jgi:starvation-inducible outer membrane lipoprotein